jgi:HAD superfamily phosphatase (TIGR01668 family)
MKGNAGRVLRPDHFADRLTSVSLEDLAAAGIEGLIVDLDNTLVGYGRSGLEADDAAWIAAARAGGLKICLVSNNFTGRVTQIAAQLGVPAVPSALKPLPRGFLKALELLGTPKHRTLVVGDQLFTDVLGARLAGMGCILTRPLVARDWLGTRILRLLERLVLGKRSPSGLFP